jgi:hypothetical protein
MEGNNTNIMVISAVGVAALVSFCAFWELSWWRHPVNTTVFMDTLTGDLRSPADPDTTNITPELELNEYLDWIDLGAVDVQTYGIFKIGKAFDTVLGPLDYTDPPFSQIVESFTKELPTYINIYRNLGVDGLLVANTIVYGEVVTNFVVDHEWLFSVSLFLGLRAITHFDYGLIFHHRPGFDISIFRRAKHGGLEYVASFER